MAEEHDKLYGDWTTCPTCRTKACGCCRDCWRVTGTAHKWSCNSYEAQTGRMVGEVQWEADHG